MGKWVHRLSQIDPISRTGVCAGCGEIEIGVQKGRWKCITSIRTHQGAAHRLAKQLNVTPKDAAALRADQTQTCDICGKKEEFGESLSIDHCHTRNEVRGRLCKKCNIGLGGFRDDVSVLEKAIEYLKLHQVK